MITDPEYSLTEIFDSIQKHKPDFVCYRNKKYYNEKEIAEFAEFAKKYSRILINYDSLKNEKLLTLFDGIHLPSSKTALIKNFTDKTIIVSTHTKDEIIKAKNADFITFSPIFDSKGRKGLGTEILNRVTQFHKNVIALGGIISEKEVEEIKKTKACGFASIRYFFT
jgi:thiamine-phosphate pyrophosphorylase